MMNSDYASSTAAVGYATVESLLDEAACNLRRYSRGSNGQRIGGSMRVVKPNSTSNSPRGSMGLGRRKTVMTDRRRMVIVDQVTGAFVSNELQASVPSKSNRPVSWHPSSSQLGSQQMYHSSYAVPCTNNEFRVFDLPPTPAAYSEFASPSSTFSPLSLPYTGYNQQPYPYSESETSYPSSSNYAPNPTSMSGQQIPNYLSTPADNTDSSLYSHFDWSNFSGHGFERSTAPPTPENFLPIQHPDPTFPADDAIPFHPLSDSTQDEEEGEILCGLGLYDNPEVGKVASLDPQLDNYRSSMSQFLGSTYRPESTGKGLKLEETWNPPPSDDEDDNDEDEDGEGEEEEEEEEATSSIAASTQSMGNSHDALSTAPSGQVVQDYERISWL